MDNFEFTKIAGAVLTALLLIFGTKALIEMNVGHKAEQPGYSLPGTAPPVAEAKADAPAAKAEAGKAAAAPADKKAADAPKGGAAAPAGGSPGAEAVALLGMASADSGKTIFSKCKACHVAEKGKASTVGPNLWGVVNRPKGSYEGFGYTEGMKGKGGNWTLEDLGTFLSNPKAFVQGTKMVFNGLPAASDRADVIAYLATLADTPVALPK